RGWRCPPKSGSKFPRKRRRSSSATPTSRSMPSYRRLCSRSRLRSAPRSSISTRSPSHPEAGIERVAQTVAEQIVGGDGEEDRKSGKHREPPGERVLLRDCEDRPPGDEIGGNADPEERQGGFGEYRR